MDKQFSPGFLIDKHISDTKSDELSLSLIEGFFSRFLSASSDGRRRKIRNCPDHLFDMLDRDQSRAFKLTPGTRMTRTPEKILMVETTGRVMPAGVAGMPVDDAPRCVKLVCRMSKARNHHNSAVCRPRQP